MRSKRVLVRSGIVVGAFAGVLALGSTPAMADGGDVVGVDVRGQLYVNTLSGCIG